MKFLYSLFIALSFFATIPSLADLENSANGEWQYLIRRGGSKSVGGNLGNPNCPMYVGYFRLDFRRVEKVNGRFQVTPEDKSFFRAKGNGPMYAVGDMYEIKGSYTPVDTNSSCDNPPTKAQNEKAPLIITKVANNGRDLEWTTDFSQGTERANAVWQVKAKYNGNDTMTGVLKAYVCDDDEKRNCSLLNTAKFEAKRVPSIKQASDQPLYKSNSPLTTLLRLIAPKTVQEGRFERKPVDSTDSYFDDSENLLKPEYVRPSLQAVFPARAQLDSATRICKGLGGVGEWPCKVCKNVNCAPGQSPTGPEERVCCFGAAPGLDICESFGCPGGGCKPGGHGKTNCI